MRRDTYGSALIPGVNVDPVDIDAGLKQLHDLGYNGQIAEMTVTYALQRWQRGEEAGAERTINGYANIITYTDWRVVLASAIAAGTQTT